MKTFYIVEMNAIDGFQAVVLANGVHSPLEQRTELECHLRNDGVRGRIIFDLFLSLGSKGRRYFFSTFDGECLTPLERATNIPPMLPTHSAELLKKHNSELDLSLLSAASAYAVRNGYEIPA